MLPKISHFRENIILDLQKALNAFLPTYIFEIYTFDKENIPFIILRDKDDDIEINASQTLKHSLKVEIKLISDNYENSKNLILKTLEILREFKSNFAVKSLEKITRDDYEILDKTYILSQIDINFIYFTHEWGY